MANIVVPNRLANRPILRRPRTSVWQFAMLAPLPIGLLVGLLSLMMGADAGYVSLQLLLFLLVIPILYLLATDERYGPALILAGFAKAFLISQIISILIWHRPDVALLNPTMTEFGIAVGVVSCIVGILVARLVVAAAPIRKPLLSWNPRPETLRWLGEVTAAIGLPAQIGWTINVSRLTADQHGGVGIATTGAPVLAFLAPLALVSMCCFAAEEIIRSDRRSMFSTRLLIVMAIYFPAILPLVSKTEPLRPVVALAVVAMVYRWRPRPGPILAGLALFILVMEVFYPAVTLARLEAFGQQRPLPVVFAEVMGKAIVDPGELAYVRAFSDDQEMGAKQVYYGRPMGFWERFAPQVTDRLISGSQYIEPKGLTNLTDAMAHIQPHVLGSKLTTDDNQIRIEMALTRQRSAQGKVSWDNAGFVGDGFVAGGIGMVIVDCLLLGLLSSAASRVLFVSKTADVLWIPLFCVLMFTFSDGGFVSGAYSNFWTWVLYIVVLYAMLWYMRSRSRVRSIATAAAAS